MGYESLKPRRTIFNGADKDAVTDVCLRICGSSLAEVLEKEAECEGIADTIIGVVLTNIEFGQNWVARQLDGSPGPMTEEMEA